MKNLSKVLLFLTTIGLIVIIAGCQGEGDTKTDTVAETESAYQQIPEVEAFMEHLEEAVHATFDTNYTAVREAAPKFTAAFEALKKAELPEFHKDVEGQFAEKLPALDEAVKAFAEVAESGDDAALDEALTGVRKSFIDFWVIFVPTVQEIEDFHDILRPAWHDYTPNEDWDALKAAMPDFVKATEAIMNAQLPPKYAYAQAKFDEGRQALKIAIDSLKVACETGTSDDIKEKMSIMHGAFHSIQSFYE